MQPTEYILQAVRDLSARSGHCFEISSDTVPGTQLFVVHTTGHPFRPEYTVPSGIFGFRVPINLPAAAPEDSFFISPAETKLKVADPVRNSFDINRAGRAEHHVVGSNLSDIPVLVFSWHLWDRSPWSRTKHTLMDHYTHCVRRFDQPERG